MTTSYTTNRALAKPANGDDVNTWDVPVNGNSDILDAILGSGYTIALSSTNVTLNQTQSNNAYFTLTGILTTNLSVFLPAIGGDWIVMNTTTGAYTVTFYTVAIGSIGVVVPQGYTASIFSDATNVYFANSGITIPNNSITNALLAQAPAGTVKGNNSGGSANVSDLTPSNVLDILGNTRGSVLARGASSWETITGTSGQFLQSNGTSADPSFASLIQVPSLSGNASKVLTNDGSSTPSWTGLTLVANGAFSTNTGASPTARFTNNMSVSRLSLGTWRVALSGLSNANYTVSITAALGGGVALTPVITNAQTSVNFVFTWFAYNTSYTDPDAGQTVHINVFGGL